MIANPGDQAEMRYVARLLHKAPYKAGRKEKGDFNRLPGASEEGRGLGNDSTAVSSTPKDCDLHPWIQGPDARM